MASTDDDRVAPAMSGAAGPTAAAGEAASPAAQLARDLGVILGCPVRPDDLLRRRDGAAATIAGLVALAARPRRQAAARLVREWAAAGSATSVPLPPVSAPASLQLESLQTPSGEKLLDGINLVGDEPGAAQLGQWASASADLCGGIPEVHLVDLDERRVRVVPGWAARIHILTALEEAGSAAPGEGGDRVARWAVTVHEAAARIYIPTASPDSLWHEVQRGLRGAAVRTLKTADRDVNVDLERSGDERFWGTAMDRTLSQRLPVAGVAADAVLQIVRLPYRSGLQVQRGIALIADRPAGEP